MLRLIVIVSLTLVYSANGIEGDGAKVDTVAREFWEWLMEIAPYYSTLRGHSRYNDRLTDMRWEAFEETKVLRSVLNLLPSEMKVESFVVDFESGMWGALRSIFDDPVIHGCAFHFGQALWRNVQQKGLQNKTEQFLNRLNDIDSSMLQTASKINYDILKDILSTFVDGYQWRFYGPLNTKNFLEGMQTNPRGFVSGIPFYTFGDFVNYLSRLGQIPNSLSQEKDRMRKAIELGHTNHNVSVKGIAAEIDAMLENNPEHSIFYLPFNDTLEKLETVPDTYKAILRREAATTVRNLLSAFDDMKTFIADEYMPNARESYGVENWEENGKKYYAACLKWHLSLDMSPEEVHQIGLDEVERISKKMEKIMERLGKTGTIKQFFEEVANDTRFHRNTGEELLEIYRELIQNATTKISPMFNNYPDLPVRVVAMPFDGPLGAYTKASEDGARPGTFLANVRKPEEISLIDMPALTFHEVVPGHHLQLSYSSKADLPGFRKHILPGSYYAIPFTFPIYTANLEGWALYAESLAVELGLYQNDYEMMGRYSLEMLRACRLVVDTGLHHFRWSRERAVEYLLKYTSNTRRQAEIEIDRYITWPGQACAYKIGELKIKELRKKAEEQLGDLFDIKEFHSILLNDGAMPLQLTETLVNSWINDTKANKKPNPNPDSAPGRSTTELLLFVMSMISVHMFV